MVLPVTQEQYLRIQAIESETDYTKRPVIPDGYSGWIAHAEKVHGSGQRARWGSAQFFQVQNARLEFCEIERCWILWGQIGVTFPGGWGPDQDGYPLSTGFVRALKSAPVLSETGTIEEQLTEQYELAIGNLLNG